MSAIPTLDALAGVSRVHTAMRAVLHELDHGFAATVVSVDSHAIYLLAPSTFHAERWHAKYPAGTVAVGGLSVPLHVAVEGDVEGGAL